MGREAGNQRGQELEEWEFFFNTVQYFAKGKAQCRGRGRGARMGEHTVREAGSTTPPVSPSNTPTYFIL